jgi:outer membrane protein OmpA-like peptidoglycan-associated protein
MQFNGWYVAAIAVVATFGVSWSFAECYGTADRPSLLVVAAHDIPAKHKLITDDLSFILTRAQAAPRAVAQPDEAIGACTEVALDENQPIAWSQLTKRGAGDDTCASAAMALELLGRIAQMPNPSEVNESTSSSVKTSSNLQWLETFKIEPKELSAASNAALGEFRSEFIKELAKRLADNSADRVFGRDRRDTASEKTAQDRRAGSEPRRVAAIVRPTEAAKITYFDVDRAGLHPDQRDALRRFAVELLNREDCRIIIHGYADRTGSQRDNLWLSWQRANSVAAALIESGVDRRLITLVPHGYEEPSVDSVTGIPVVLNRRAETYATCFDTSGLPSDPAIPQEPK